MSTPLYALIGFVFWTIALLFAVAGSRVAMVSRGEIQPTAFTPTVPHGGDMYWRLNRAHLNCLENLPLFGAVVLTAVIIGIDSAAFDNLARVFIGARIVQSVVHISSGSATAVNIRFGFYLIQTICVIGIALMCVM